MFVQQNDSPINYSSIFSWIKINQVLPTEIEQNTKYLDRQTRLYPKYTYLDREAVFTLSIRTDSADPQNMASDQGRYCLSLIQQLIKTHQHVVKCNPLIN